MRELKPRYAAFQAAKAIISAEKQPDKVSNVLSILVVKPNHIYSKTRISSHTSHHFTISVTIYLLSY